MTGWSLLLAALLFSAPAAAAHAKLVRSQPKANAKLEQPPALVELWFNEELEAGFNTIEVRDAQGKRFDRGEVTLTEGGKKAQVELEALGAGKYTCAWKVLSEDEHTIRGRFTFTVTAAEEAAATREASPSPAQQAGEQSSGQPSGPVPQEVAPPPGEDSTGESSVTWVDNLVRWLTYLTMITLFGGFAFRLFVLGPALDRDHTGDAAASGDALDVSARRTVMLFWLSLAMLALASLATLVLQASAVFGKPVGEALSPLLLGQVIARTGFGRAWLLQVLATASLVAIVFYLARRAKRRPPDRPATPWWLGLAASAALLLSPSLTGHAAAANEYRFATLSDWLHLLAGGFWVGGLFHLVLALPPALRVIEDRGRRRALSRVISLFTRTAIASVSVVALAGLYNTWVHVGSLQALWGTDYGRTLLLKLILVLLMILLGGINNFHFGRQAARLAGAGELSPAFDGAKFERGFSRSVALEAGLGVAVLLITAVLVFLTPARTHPMNADAQAAGAATSARGQK